VTAMREEIGEIPAAVARLLADGAAETDAAAAAVRTRMPRWASIAGRGTSDHAATYGRYLLETRLGIATGLAAPSVSTVYGSVLDWRDGLVIGVSQSGRSPDVVEVVERARSGGSLTIAVTNEPTSPLARVAEHVLWCRAGPERSVAATKTYVTSLVALAGLVARASEPRTIPGVAESLRAGGLRAGLPALPDVLETTLDAVAAWATGAIADEFSDSDRALVVSRGFNLATALETALKLKETAGIFADGYSAADLEHGPVALAGPAIPLLAFRPDGPVGARMDGVLDRLERTGARPWVVGGPELVRRRDLRRARSLAVPVNLAEALTPIPFAIPGELLAEAVAVRRGHDPDAPRGLTKVTLTR